MGFFDFLKKKNDRKTENTEEQFFDLLSKALDAAKQNNEKIKPVLLKNQNVWEANYGIDEANPIISESLDGTSEYLSRLCTLDGKKFTWSEHTSIRATVHGLADVGEDRYTLFLDGQPYADIFFVPYIGKAKFPPVGLSFSDDNRNWDEERRAAEQTKLLEIENEKAQKWKQSVLDNIRVYSSNYGKSESNPTITESIDVIPEYLGRLCTLDGKKFTWSESTNIRATIDWFDRLSDVEEVKYTLYLDGQPYTDIYIVPGIKKPEFPPVGLSFSDDRRDWEKERLVAERAKAMGLDRDTTARIMKLSGEI